SATAIVLVIGVLGAAVFVGHRLNLREQLGSAFKFGSNSTAVQRVELWKSAVKVAEHHPILGTGPDTFRIKFPTYQTRKFVALYGPDQLANGPHNTFFNYLATEGFPGLFAFLAVLLFAAMRGVGAWRRFRRRERLGGDDAGPARQRRILLSGIMAAVVAYVLQASFNVRQIGLTASFWLLLGLLGVLALGAGVPDTLRPDRLVRVGSGAEAETEAEPDDAGGSPAPAGSLRPPRSTRAHRR